MTKHLTPADFAAVPWGGRAIPPEGSEFAGAVRVPTTPSDSKSWIANRQAGIAAFRSDDDMADEGWTIPVPADPWDVLPDALQAAWDAGEERAGEAGELFIHKREDGSLEPGLALSGADEVILDYRFRPRPRPSWQDAEVVEASTALYSERRHFWRVAGRMTVWFDSNAGTYGAEDLIDPVPMTVQKKEER